jgi:hypothetical protein
LSRVKRQNPIRNLKLEMWTIPKSSQGWLHVPLSLSVGHPARFLDNEERSEVTRYGFA